MHVVLDYVLYLGYSYRIQMLVPDNTAPQLARPACTYRPLCYTVIGLTKVLITLLVILCMILTGYLVFTQSLDQQVHGQDPAGQDAAKFSNNIENYYPGFLGLYRSRHWGAPGRDLDKDGMQNY